MLDFSQHFAHTKMCSPFGDLYVMKKIFAALFSFLLFLVIVPKIHAQSVFPSVPTVNATQQTYSVQSTNKTAYPLQTDSDVPQNFHTYSQNVFIEILTSISCILTGYDPLTASGKCLGINTVTHKIGYVDGGQGGAIGIVGNMIGMTFNIPVSSVTYVRDLASHFGITKTGLAAPIDVGGNKVDNDGTFASGYGYAGLKPLIGLWQLFRNIVYLLFVLIFIVIGVGIMLRVNVDARSVMSIQNQLPKIIIGILLITFSYAIAGFIVDMMYVSMYLVYYLFYTFTQQGAGVDMGGLSPSSLQGSNPISAMGGLGGASGIAVGAAKPFGHILASLFDNSFGNLIAKIVGTMIGGGVGSVFGPVGAVVGGAIGLGIGFFAGSKLLGVIGGLLAYIIITIAVLWSMFRLWFLLLKSYVFFLIDVILAPFWIGLGLLPKGASAGFGSWMRDIVANLAVFPATLFILLLGKIITAQFGQDASAHPFVPPLIGNFGDIDSFGPIIGLGFILLLPGVATMVRETLKAPGFKYTQQIAQSLRQGQKVGGMLFGKTKDALWHTNPKDGSPERLKKLYLDRFKNASNGKVTKTLTSPIAKVGSRIPFGIGNRIKSKRTFNASESALERSAENQSSILHGSTDMSRRAGGINNTTGKFEGTIDGEKAVDNGDGSVTIFPKSGGERIIYTNRRPVHWDRGVGGTPLSTSESVGPEVAAGTSAETAADASARGTEAGRAAEEGEPTPTSETVNQEINVSVREEAQRMGGFNDEELAQIEEAVRRAVREKHGDIAEATEITDDIRGNIRRVTSDIIATHRSQPPEEPSA